MWRRRTSFTPQHAALAARHGKHLLIEKPMALTLDECAAIIDAARRAGVHLVVGHSHSFDAPVQRLRELIESGDFGAVRMINAINYTDYLYRPRRPEELDTAQGGGAVFNQAAHQVDMVRLIGGGQVTSVRAVTGAWDRSRPTEGAYAALLTFADGAFASLTYNGYGHFDSDEFEGWIGEMGQQKTPYAGAPRPRFANAQDEARIQERPQLWRPLTIGPPRLGLQRTSTSARLLVSCERARSARAAEWRDDLSRRRGAARRVAAADGAARRRSSTSFIVRSCTARRPCMTAPGRWRRSRSCWRSCAPRTKAATSRSIIRFACHETRSRRPRRQSCATGAKRCRTIVSRIW